MTGDGTSRTGTGIGTAHTALAHRGTGADITARITVRSSAHIGTHGATVRGDITAITTHGTTEDFMTLGITEDTGEDTGEDIMPDIGDGMTHGITTTIIAAGMTRIAALLIQEDPHTSKTATTDSTPIRRGTA